MLLEGRAERRLGGHRLDAGIDGRALQLLGLGPEGKQAPGQELQLQAVATVQHRRRTLCWRQVVAGRHGQQIAYQLGEAKAGGIADRDLDESAAHGRAILPAAVPDLRVVCTPTGRARDRLLAGAGFPGGAPWRERATYPCRTRGHWLLNPGAPEARRADTFAARLRPVAESEIPARILRGTLPPCDYTEFVIPPRPQGWVQHGEHWGLWWGNRQIASVQPCPKGIRVTLACRKLWQDKQVRAASIDQGKRYAERWWAARVLPELPLREAVARLVKKDEPLPPPPRPALTLTERQQQRRFDAIPLPKL